MYELIIILATPPSPVPVHLFLPPTRQVLSAFRKIFLFLSGIGKGEGAPSGPGNNRVGAKQRFFRG
jgi:hypothetical protein